jgi:hypothetical protein
MDKPAAYINLGDSMSIDLYPYLDLSSRRSNTPQELGAASLLYSNHSSIWSEFEYKDLRTGIPDIKFVNLAEDGATTFDYLDGDYLKLLESFSDSPLLLTITLGGNDLLNLLLQNLDDDLEFEKEVRNLNRRFDSVLERLTSALPRAICVLNSIYDPTDGTGILPGLSPFKDKLVWLGNVNHHIKRVASDRGALFADVHGRFLGHGLSAPEAERWYWEPNPIEPSALGASELRRLWLETMEAEDLISI